MRFCRDRPVFCFRSFWHGLSMSLTQRCRTLLSFMFYAPSLVGNAYFIWKVAFSGDSYGYINSLLLSIGIITEPVIWLREPSYLMPIIILVQLWQSMGISFLANISGLQNVSRDLYEAGTIDGIRTAGRSFGTSHCRRCSICFCSARSCRFRPVFP